MTDYQEMLILLLDDEQEPFCQQQRPERHIIDISTPGLRYLRVLRTVPGQFVYVPEDIDWPEPEV